MNEIKTTSNNLPAKQEESLGFIKNLLKAVESGNTFEVAKIERSVTIDKAVTGMTLKQACNVINEDVIIVTLIALIQRTSSFFNISRPMTEEQATDTAFLLFEKYPYETLEDFILMMKEGKSGKYGKNYNRLDGAIIFEWMESYMEQKSAHLEKLHRTVKSNSDSTDLIKIVQHYSNGNETDLEGQNSVSNTGRTVAEALKKAIDFDQAQGDEAKEKEYYEFRKNYISKNSGIQK